MIQEPNAADRVRTERQRGTPRRRHRRAWRRRSTDLACTCSIGRPIHRTTARSTRLQASPVPLQDAVLRLFAAAVARNRSALARRRPSAHRRRRRRAVRSVARRDDGGMRGAGEKHGGAGRRTLRRAGVPVRGSGGDRRRAGVSRRSGEEALNGVALRMKQPAWRPDFGPDRPHPTAGATAIGARPILIAYNVNLASNRLGRRETHRVGHSRKQRRAHPRQGDGRAARPGHRAGVDEPDQLQRDVDDDGLRRRRARGGGGWRARARERDRRTGARRTRSRRIRGSQIETARGRPRQGVGNAP